MHSRRLDRITSPHEQIDMKPEMRTPDSAGVATIVDCV